MYYCMHMYYILVVYLVWIWRSCTSGINSKFTSSYLLSCVIFTLVYRYLCRCCSFKVWTLVILSSSSIWDCCFCRTKGQGGILGKRHELKIWTLQFIVVCLHSRIYLRCVIIFLWRWFSLFYYTGLWVFSR